MKETPCLAQWPIGSGFSLVQAMTEVKADLQILAPSGIAIRSTERKLQGAWN
jgi:hypothetical protein